MGATEAMLMVIGGTLVLLLAFSYFGMGFFKSLVKHHGITYFEPIGKALAAAGIKKPNPLNPSHMWALKDVALPYAKWMLAQRLWPVVAAKLPWALHASRAGLSACGHWNDTGEYDVQPFQLRMAVMRSRTSSGLSVPTS